MSPIPATTIIIVACSAALGRRLLICPPSRAPATAPSTSGESTGQSITAPWLTKLPTETRSDMKIGIAVVAGMICIGMAMIVAM
nr:hypothetical protein [Sinisalibacter aestuarii]